jgi:TFIIF-interacting CTD phosphatase-like protein
MIMNTLPFVDPHMQYLAGAFGPESMVIIKGDYHKDLSYLNRDLRNVIVIDKSADNVIKEKGNVITLPEFKGD